MRTFQHHLASRGSARDPEADEQRLVGWLLTVAGALFIFAGVVANLHIYFRPTSLFNTLVMLVLLAGGLGLIARAMRPHRATGE